MLDFSSLIPDEVPPEYQEVQLFLVKKVKKDVDALLDELARAIIHSRRGLDV